MHKSLKYSIVLTHQLFALMRYDHLVLLDTSDSITLCDNVT